MTIKKTVLFFPLNSPGHINSCIGIADKLKDEHGCRIVFLLLGKPMGNTIGDHGHELVTLEEANVYEDYEIKEDEDLLANVDEELKKKQGESKKKFPGAFKWPQIIQRYQEFLQLEPVEAFIKSVDVMEKFMLGELIDNHDAYSAAIDSINPDLIIVDAYYIPPCVVNMKNTPWVRLYTANPSMIVGSKLQNGVKPPPMCGFKIFNKEVRAAMREKDPVAWDLMVKSWQEATDKIVETCTKVEGPLRRFLEDHGCEPLQPGQQAHESKHVNLYLYPKAIDYDQDDDIFEYPARWFRCDSLIRSPTKKTNPQQAQFWEDKLIEAMKGKRAMVYFSLGSIASGNVQLMKRILSMLTEDIERLYVVSKGANGEKYDLNPENMIGDNFIPQTFFLERADLAIIHGGNNSVTECLYYGLPMIVLPAFADQFDNAQRIEDLGLGRRLNLFKCTNEEMTDAIQEVLTDENTVNKAREIGRDMRARDRVPGKVANMLKRLIDNGHLEREFIEDCRRDESDGL